MKKSIKSKRSKQSVKRALLVEGHDGQRQFIGTFLKPYFEIGGAGSAIEAMSMLRSGFIPDVIVFGTKITDMDSGVFLQALKSSGFFGKIPIVAIGIRDNKNEEHQLRFNGISAYYGTPFDPLDLQSHLIRVAD
jgi:response regulator RpfG family c-di-GMP phosphodiesterase